MVMAHPWASFLPAESTTAGHQVLVAQGFRGETPVYHGRVTAAPSALCPPWRRCIWSPSRLCGSGGGGWLVMLLRRSDIRGAQGLCWRGGAEESWVPTDLGWCTWCSGDLGSGLV
jgi:hypothetical protein